MLPLEKMVSLCSLTKEVLHTLTFIVFGLQDSPFRSGNMEATSDGMLASPGVAEKGYFDLRMSVSADGGHSSVPPKHTVSSYDYRLCISQLNVNFHTEHWYSRCSDCAARSESTHAPYI